MSGSIEPELTLDPDVLSVYPELTVQGFRVELNDAGIVDKLDVPDVVQLQQKLESRGLTLEILAQDALIAGWRSAFQRAGLKPSTFKSSPDALARRVFKGSSISTPLQLVNLYCAVSVSFLAPLGAYDVGRLPNGAKISLRFARPATDRFLPIGGRPQDFPLSERIPVYATGDEILCWAYNCRDSANTCLVKDTQSILFVGEAVTPAQSEALQAAMTDLRERLALPGVLAGPVAEASGVAPSAVFEPPSSTE